MWQWHLSCCKHWFCFDFFHITMEKVLLQKEKENHGLHICRPKLSVFSHEYSSLKPLSRLTPAIFPYPVESAVRLADCAHRCCRLECRSLPASSPASPERGRGGGEGLICTLMERSVLSGLAGVPQLRVSGNLSCLSTINVVKTLSPAGSIL